MISYNGDLYENNDFTIENSHKIMKNNSKKDSTISFSNNGKNQNSNVKCENDSTAQNL